MNSTFRTGFILKGLSIILILCLPIIMLSYDDGSNSWANNNRFLVTTISILWLFGGVSLFAHRTIYILKITETEIYIKRLFKITLKYRLDDICHLSMKTATLKRRHYPSPGYEILTIGFKNGDYIDISQDTYQNYNEMHHLLVRAWKSNLAKENNNSF